MKPDAYDLLNAALTMWGKHAMEANDATNIRKNSYGIPLHIEIDGELREITNVKYDSKLGIVFIAE